MAQIIAKSFKNASITENEDGQAVFEEHIQTLRISKKNNKFVIEEMYRKGKPSRRLKTLSITKNRRKISDVASEIESDKIKFRTRIENIHYFNKNSKLIIVQSNYRRTLSEFQLIGFVEVMDIRRNIKDFFVGFSSSIGEKREELKAKTQVIAMAIGKFISKHGVAKKSGDIVAIIRELRYQNYISKKGKGRN